MKNVTVTKDNEGRVVVPNASNPEYAYIRVESKVTEFNGGFLNVKTRSAIIPGKKVDLEAFVRENNLRAGTVIDGRILVKESTEPFYEGQQPKTAGAEGAVCTIGGQPIYRKAIFTTDENDQDVLIKHDNVVSGSSTRVNQPNQAVTI